MSNFQQLEVVDRGSETQPQVGENVNTLKNDLTAKRACLGRSSVGQQ